MPGVLLRVPQEIGQPLTKTPGAGPGCSHKTLASAEVENSGVKVKDRKTRWLGRVFSQP